MSAQNKLSNRKSTDFCAVPDFRSSNGLFNILKSDNKLKASGKHLFDASVYQTDDSTTSFHEMVRTMSKLVSGAKPTAFHEMLATLASEGRLLRLYTQNIDGIDTSLPPLASSIPLERRGPWPRTIQLHGSLEKMVCSKCSTLTNFDPAIFEGPIPPLCTVCLDLDKIRTENAGKRSHGVGRLRPRMVLYHEGNPDDEAIGTVMRADLRARPDAVIVAGTSMEIPGVKRIVRELCGVVRDRRDGVAIWINRGPPPVAKEFEDCWDLVVAGDCDAVAHNANMRRWDDEGNDYKGCTESEAENAKQNASKVKIIIKTAKSKSPSPQTNLTPQKSSTPAMMMTPAESPKSKATKLPNIPFQFPPMEKNAEKASKQPRKPSSKKTGLKSSKLVSGIASTSNSLKRSGQAKIKTVFKVKKNLQGPDFAPFTPRKEKSDAIAKFSKPQHPSPTGPEKARRLLESINEPVPMALISPNSAKSNGPLSFSDAENKPLKASKVEVPLRTEILETPKSPHDISPLETLSEDVVPLAGLSSLETANIADG